MHQNIDTVRIFRRDVFQGEFRFDEMLGDTESFDKPLDNSLAHGFFRGQADKLFPRRIKDAFHFGKNQAFARKGYWEKGGMRSSSFKSSQRMTRFFQMYLR